jgi:hypothetical protein
MIDWTPLPGTRILTPQVTVILAQFHQRYRIHTAGRSSNVPTWCTFPQSSRIDEHIFDSRFFHTFSDLYLYVENGRHLFRAAPQEIQAYFTQRQPWETDWDYYIFDPNLHWCISVTHELTDGCAILVTGDYPADQYH